jgi:N-acetylmuramoyl-L-alanine amidase
LAGVLQLLAVILALLTSAGGLGSLLAGGTAAPAPVTVTPPPTVAAAPPPTHPVIRPPAVVRSGRLAGKVIGIDPGHNGRNYTSPSFMSRQIWNGRAYEDCDTTGTQTAGGYTEPSFTWAVSLDLARRLRAEGATVVWTRTSNTGLGPCVDQRAKMLNRGHADLSLDIHADGGPTGGRGFTVLLPVADGPNDAVITSSVRFGTYLRSRMRTMTGMPVSTYYGDNGFAYRNDLAGLNLTSQTSLLLDCGNMRTATDWALLRSAAWLDRAAAAMTAAVTDMFGR